MPATVGQPASLRGWPGQLIRPTPRRIPAFHIQQTTPLQLERRVEQGEHVKTVAVLEVGLMDKIVPLVGGYLESYASADPWLKSNYRFEKYYATTRTDRRALLSDILGLNADIYAFSCYVWNTGLILSLVRHVYEAKPDARVMLGGPQVMNQADRLIPSVTGDLAICNGEGEAIFADYLRELTEPHPDLSKVQGISFRADTSIITTERRGRLTSLDDIPSPFLNGLFRGQFRTSIFETNRGCPFRCSFCYWGAATNDRVQNFSTDRVRDEITWIAKAGIPLLFLADANWGLTKRDVEISRHIADCRRIFTYPRTVYYSSAKNAPERVSEIVALFDEAEILAAQPISLQTQDEHTLKSVDRHNIKKSAFIQVQKRLDERRVSSYTELIWPLPGETLDSFRRGIDELCRFGSNTNTLVVYPHLLLLNTPMHRQRHDLKLVTRRIGDGTCESDLIVETASVPQADYEDGLRFYYAALLLYNLRGLHATMTYLYRKGITSYANVFLSFIRFWSTGIDSPLVQFVEEVSVKQLGVVKFNNYGMVTHYALGEYRLIFERLLSEFVSQHYSRDENCRFVFELDRVLLPFVYSSTPIQLPDESFEFLKVRRAGFRQLDVTVPSRFRDLCADVLSPYGESDVRYTGRFLVNHARNQYPYWPARGLEGNSDYCYAMLTRIERIVPVCEAIPIPRMTAATLTTM